MSEELIFRRIKGTPYLEVPVYHGHRRSKNWYAEIHGLDPKYKFARRFFNTIKIDGYPVIHEEEFGSPVFVQIHSMYHTRSGYPSPDEDQKKYNGFWKVTRIDEEGVWGIRVDELTIFRYFSQKTRQEVIEG